MSENSQITVCPLAPPKGQPEVVAVTQASLVKGIAYFIITS